MRPVLVNCSHDQSKLWNSKPKPNLRAAASMARMPSGTTSLPMPSPGMTAILYVFAMCGRFPWVPLKAATLGGARRLINWRRR
jgi:hypothetical protein